MKKQDIYLVAQYFLKPKARVQTQQTGWQNSESNFGYDEKMEITRGLKNNVLVNAKIILNLSQTRVVKNSWRSGATFEELFAYFYKNYSDYVTMTLAKLDPESFKAVLDKPKTEDSAINN